MPKRTDLRTIMLIGSGPIVIGQACEFDYSGTQAVKALKEEGYRVVLVNSNPATIMTDPELADRTYIEPITREVVAEIIARERPDALLPTMGGQTGLNVAMQVHADGVLEKYGVEMIGAKPDAIHRAEDREEFRDTMGRIGLDVPRSALAHNLDEARAALDVVGFPAIIRPAYTLGGAGGGVAYNVKEYEDICARGLHLSMVSEVLIEESIIGWKEFELEVMRDRLDNVVIICSIENVDPMGVHTGDSITVAPAQTLSDREYQRMRDAAIAIMRAIGVETGGSNVQFATNPEDGRLVVIEMNPRVSRSSALASKATGFPIAKFAAKLAVGYTLDEIRNDITRETPASFEPTIDYVVTKVPRFTFEKFVEADATLTTAMKSVGETMAIGRTFKESLGKALRGLEIGRAGLGADGKDPGEGELKPEDLRQRLRVPNAGRLFFVAHALRTGMPVETVHELTRIDPWFLHQILDMVERERQVAACAALSAIDDDLLRGAKRDGLSDRQIAYLIDATEREVREERYRRGIRPVYKLVDTCAAEFKAYTPYYYSTYEDEDEVRLTSRKRIVILGGGPNRIGQGIEFDYCCCHAAFALGEIGYETVMINSNPETVSTDYDTSDMLFFEPLTVEDVLHVVERLKPEGVIVQFGGQTPLNLAQHLEAAGVPILGTSVDSIDRASDRERFQSLLHELEIRQPRNGTATSVDEALEEAHRIGFPCVVRPSYVLGGRGMETVFDEESLRRYMKVAVDVSPDHPVLLDRFMEESIELDVDAISDGTRVVIGGIMEHVEEAGIHSGDSGCCLPTYTIPPHLLDTLRRHTERIGLALGVRGLMNIQFLVKSGEAYVIEVNPRASRTVPFVAKAVGVPLAKIAAQVMTGRTLDEIGIDREVIPDHFCIKQPVFPFDRFPGADIILGPEMRSTGEVMGMAADFGVAFAKSMEGAGRALPQKGNVFLSVRDSDKRGVAFLGRRLTDLGLKILATGGTHEALRRAGVEAQRIHKLGKGRPDVLDALKNGEIDLIINTPVGKGAHTDEGRIRQEALGKKIPIITTISGAAAAVNGITAIRTQGRHVRSLQEYNAGTASPDVMLADEFADFIGGVESREIELPTGPQRVWDSGGPGRPVVLLHGIAGSRRVFFRVVPLLARNRRVIVPMLRGERRPLRALSVEDLVADLDALFVQLDVSGVTLVGVSFGAAAAMAFAARRSPRLRELVLQGGFPRFRLRTGDRVALFFAPAVPPALGARYFAWRVLHGPEAHLFREHAPGAEVMLSQWSGQTPFRTLMHRVRMIGRMDLRDDVRRIDVPLTLAHGDADRVVPRRYFEELCTLRPDARRVDWEGVGHIAMVTHPEEFVRLIESGH